MHTKYILYLLKKASYLVASLFIVISLTFLLMKLVPGDPFDDEQQLPKEIQLALRQHYGLDQPWHVQYLSYLHSILRGDLGPSFKYKDRSVNDIIREGFYVSALLGLEALLIALGLGVLIGTLAAIQENRWFDQCVTLLATASISIPSFILATLLQYFVALQWNLLPLARWESVSHTILPALSLAMLPTAFISRLIRSNMVEILRSEYIKTAKAKGLSKTVIIFRHALRNAFLPVLTYLGQLVANILVGSFVVEKIFSIPGLGQWFVNSVMNRDYTVIMGLTIFYSAIFMTLTLLVELMYGYLDPRIQTSGESA